MDPTPKSLLLISKYLNIHLFPNWIHTHSSSLFSFLSLLNYHIYQISFVINQNTNLLFNDKSCLTNNFSKFSSHGFQKLVINHRSGHFRAL